MDKPKTIAIPFSNKGLLLKSDQALIPPDRYFRLTNMVTGFEGTLTVRNGMQLLTSFLVQIATISKMRLTNGTSVHYLAIGSQIWRSSAALPATGGAMPFAPVLNGIAPAGQVYTAYRVGMIDAPSDINGVPYKYFACPAVMAKDNGTLPSLSAWGILPPTQPITAANTASGVGPPATTNPYFYVYTYVNTTTNAESNPCVYMLNGVQSNGNSISVVGALPTDIQVNVVRVYRSGGSFSDGLYRQVGQLQVVPAIAPFTYLDNNLDADIAGNNLLETDNDPPITSTLPISMIANISLMDRAGAVGINNCQISGFTQSPVGGLAAITIGSLVGIGDTNNAVNEYARVVSVNPPADQLVLYLQRPRTLFKMYITCSAIAAGPASIALSAFSCVFLAGDVHNPNVLYQSKVGRPESFPLLEQTTEIVRAINVGASSDPILGLVEYGAQVVCLCAESIYTVTVYSGVMGTPVKTPARRGILGKRAWVRVSNEIWYVSYDGVYAYSGGEEIWKSEAIDPLFTSYLGPQAAYIPMDVRIGIPGQGADIITMDYSGNELFITYNTIFGDPQRLRYHLKLDRWNIDSLVGGVNSAVNLLVTDSYTESDTGNRLLGTSIGTGTCSLMLDNSGNTDGWVNNVNDGSVLPYLFEPGAISETDRKNLLFSDYAVELSNSGTVSCQVAFGFNSTNTPDQTITIGASTATTRYRSPQSLNGGLGIESDAMSIQFHSTGNRINKDVYYSFSTTFTELSQIKRGIAFDYDDLGYPNLKTLQRLTVDIDTKGITATIQLLGDGKPMGNPIPITTNFSTRKQEIWLDSPDYICRMVRLIITPGTDPVTGLLAVFNYYTHQFDFLKQPEIITYASSYSIQSTGVSDSAALLATGSTDPTYSVISGPAQVGIPAYPFPMVVAKLAAWYAGDTVSQWLAFTNPIKVLASGNYTVQSKFNVFGADLQTNKIQLIIGAAMNLVAIFLNGVQVASNLATFTVPTSISVSGVVEGSNTIQFVVSNPVGGFPGLRVSIASVPQGDIELEWSDLGYDSEKTLRALHIEADTGGVPATIRVEGDGRALDSPFSITTTYQDRKRTISMPSDLTARMIRTVMAPGPNGYVHFYNHKYDFFKEPSSLTYFDSLEFTFGYSGYSFIKQVWIQYQCDTPVTITFLSDGGNAYHTQILPAQPYPLREVQRFYLPDHGIISPIPVFGTGVTSPGVLTAQGGPDIHWVMTSIPNNPNYSPTPPVIGILAGVWYVDVADSQWVSQLGAAANVAAGMYTYTTTFDMTGLDPTTAVLNGKIGNDDQLIAVLLNGIPVVVGPLGGFRSPTNITIRSGFKNGINTLSAQVRNGGSAAPPVGGPNPSGFRLAISGSANASFLNKSKRHQFIVSSSSPFKIYEEGSRLEYMLCGRDQRKSYSQMPFNELIQPQP